MRWILLVLTLISILCFCIAEEERACWQDEDCRRYPICRTRSLACRCQLQGTCLLARGYHQRCYLDTHCTVSMVCNQDAEVCQCPDGYRYSRYVKQCTVFADDNEPPRFADLPNADEEDASAPAEIPATYGGPILIGIIGMGMVVLCLGTALWCRCTSPTTPPSMAYAENAGEKIPLGQYYAPQAPSRHTLAYLSINPRPY